MHDFNHFVIRYILFSKGDNLQGQFDCKAIYLHAIHQHNSNFTGCQCPCSKTRRQVIIKTTQELESKVAATKKSLTVKKANLSAQTRKKISAKDARPSATSLGSVLGLGIIITALLIIVISDIPLMVEHIRYGPRKRNKRVGIKA
jgi:hypothetical protein